MAVLPESMDKLDINDPESALSVLENYIRYMGERIEFSFSNMGKTISAAGVSSVEIYILLQALSQTVTALQSTVSGMQGDIRTLQRTVNEHADRLDVIEDQFGYIYDTLDAFDQRITALEQ